MSDVESSESSDEEYVPKEGSESDSEDAIQSPESDLEEYKSKNDNKAASPKLTEEEKEKNEKQLWESFMSDIEKDKNIASKKCELKELGNNSEDIKDKKVDNINKTLPTLNNSKLLYLKRPSASALSITNILGQPKQPKKNVLQKSKEDWDKFVDEEGIKNDLKIFNRGKHGFLERKAFEARTEMKQYEIERDLRLQKNLSKK